MLRTEHPETIPDAQAAGRPPLSPDSSSVFHEPTLGESFNTVGYPSADPIKTSVEPANGGTPPKPADNASPLPDPSAERARSMNQEGKTDMLGNDHSGDGAGGKTALNNFSPAAVVSVLPEPLQIKKPNLFTTFLANNYTYFLLTLNVVIGVWLGYGYYLLVKAAKDLPLEDWGLEWLLSAVAPFSMLYNAMMSISFSKDFIAKFLAQWNKNSASRAFLLFASVVGTARIFAGYQLSEDSLAGLPCSRGSFQCTDGFKDTQIYAAMPYNFATSALSTADLLYLMYCAYRFYSLGKKTALKPLAVFLMHKRIYTDKKRLFTCDTWKRFMGI